MNRGLPAALAVAAPTLSLVPSPAVAADAVQCSFSYHPKLSPGLSLTPGSGAITSDLATGVAGCTGVLNGANITGPGKFAFEGTYEGGSCQGGGTGKGFVLAKIPTYTGEVSIKDPVTFKFGTGSGFPPGVGDWTGARTTGRYLVLPTKGDCVSSPVVEAKGQGPWEISS